MCAVETKQNSGHSNHHRAGHEADIRSLPYEKASFDVALDKGTMDALMTSKGDVWVGRVSKILAPLLMAVGLRTRRKR